MDIDIDIEKDDIVELVGIEGWFKVQSIDSLYKKVIVSHPPFWGGYVVDLSSVRKVYRNTENANQNN